jgi:transposase
MQQSAALVAGIDIGASELHVATSTDKAQPVISLDLTDLTWAEQLSAILAPGALVAVEPTGWHYSAPIIALLQHIGAQVLIVEHRVTGKVRDLRVAGVKNDTTDARALFYAALQAAQEQPLHGTHPAQPDLESASAGLRLLILSHKRAVKECTRTTNRLHQVAHSIWPALGQHLSTYLRAINAGFITPADLHHLVGKFSLGDGHYFPLGFEHGTSRNNLKRLADDLPPWLDGERMRPVIQSEADNLAINEQRAQVTAELIQKMVTDPPFKDITRLWLTIPAAGLLDCAAIHGATHGQAKTLTPAQFRAMVGAHPHTSQSGETTESSASRQGFAPAKAALYLWVLRLIKQADNPVAEVYQTRKAAGYRYSMAAARFKLVNILSGIARTGTPYIYAVPGERNDWLLPDADALSAAQED